MDVDYFFLLSVQKYVSKTFQLVKSLEIKRLIKNLEAEVGIYYFCFQGQFFQQIVFQKQFSTF